MSEVDNNYNEGQLKWNLAYIVRIKCMTHRSLLYRWARMQMLWWTGLVSSANNEFIEMQFCKVHMRLVYLCELEYVCLLLMYITHISHRIPLPVTRILAAYYTTV